MWRFYVYSIIGIICFFVPITIGENNTIIIDHIVNWLKVSLAPVLPYYV